MAWEKVSKTVLEWNSSNKNKETDLLLFNKKQPQGTKMPVEEKWIWFPLWHLLMTFPSGPIHPNLNK